MRPYFLVNPGILFGQCTIVYCSNFDLHSIGNCFSFEMTCLSRGPQLLVAAGAALIARLSPTDAAVASVMAARLRPTREETRLISHPPWKPLPLLTAARHDQRDRL